MSNTISPPASTTRSITKALYIEQLKLPISIHDKASRISTSKGKPAKYERNLVSMRGKRRRIEKNATTILAFTSPKRATKLLRKRSIVKNTTDIHVYAMEYTKMAANTITKCPPIRKYATNITSGRA